MRIEEHNPSIVRPAQSQRVTEIISQDEKERLFQDKKFVNLQEKEASIFNQEEINNALDKLNSTLETYNQDLRFKYYEEAERMMVQVIDIPTNEVIKEIPPEEILKMVARIKRMVGMIIDETI